MAFPTYGELLSQWAGGEPEPIVLRTNFDSGPAKQVRTKSQTTVKKPLSILLTQTELANFTTWFRGAECNWGVGWFNWVDYTDGTTKQARVVGGLYSFNAQIAEQGAEVKYLLSITLEILES